MNGLEEIQIIIKNFVNESKQSKEQIVEIERRRNQLAQVRNKKKNANTSSNEAEINELGKQICELGNQSQELQNKLDIKFNEVKKIVNLTIDNLITEIIRKTRKINEEREELEDKILLQEERNTKYKIQTQEFYERFGRMPELSENAKKEDEIQDRQCSLYKARIEDIEELMNNTEKELEKLAKIKRDFKNENWTNIINNINIQETAEIEQSAEANEEEAIELPLMQEEIQVKELEPIEYIKVEEFEPIEEIGELDIEEVTEQKTVDEIEELARAIVEEIIEEQTKDLNIGKVEEKREEPVEQEIIAYEENEKEEKVKKQPIKEKVTLSNIIAKIEDGEVVYKAQVSNGEEFKVYPTLEARNVLLNDNESREEIKEILIDYVVAQHKILDNTVIKKIDPTVCEVLEKFAKKYNYDAKYLIYNYAMSFSKNRETEIEIVIPITYNFYYKGSTNLSRIEKKTISKICKYAIKNDKIDLIGSVGRFNKIKYIFKRLFTTSNIGALPEGKY